MKANKTTNKRENQAKTIEPGLQTDETIECRLAVLAGAKIL